MCLDYKLPKSEIKKLPKEFTAYKVVLCDGPEEYQFVFFSKQIAATNRLQRKAEWQRTSKKCEAYIPYYHSFRTKRGAKKWGGPDSAWCIIKIKIKRKDVTCVGIQDNCRVIVSRAFTTDFEEIQ